jgi:uncharacterized membrane protein (UPF0127 family)
MRAAGFALMAAAAAHCTRTPAEDFPTRVTAVPPAAPIAAPTSTANALDAGRCMLATPVDAPATNPRPAASCPPDPEANQKVPVVHVAFPDAPQAAVEADLVSTAHDTQRGLMYRKSMPESRGMLFDLRVRSEHEFWMHNTCIPLDLLYVDDDGFIVGIVENAPTLDDTPRGVGCPSRYVLEVNAGWTRRHGVKAGQHITIPPEARGS